MLDNDPKHTSRIAKQVFEDNGINWWKTPAESPNLNPIENLRYEYILCKVKPKTKRQLVDGILAFLKTVDIVKCNKYISDTLEK